MNTVEKSVEADSQSYFKQHELKVSDNEGPKTEPTIQKTKNNCDIDDAELIDDKVDSSSQDEEY